MRLSRGKNIVEASWDDGVLSVRFQKSGTYAWSGVPEEKFIKLCRSLYPDRQFTLTIKGKYPIISRPEKTDAQKDVPRVAPRQDSGSDAQLFGPASEPSVQERNATATVQHGVCVGAVDARRPERRLTVETYRASDGLTFDEPTHTYRLNGQKLMSLTQILSASGLVDYSAVDPQVLANKAEFGRKVHQFCLWHDQDELGPDQTKTLLDHPKYGPRLEGWRQFVEDFKFMPSLPDCETPMAAKVNGMLYGLTVDRYGVIGEGENIANVVVEIKTSAKPEAHHAIQTAGQAICFKAHSEALQMPLKRYAVYLLPEKNQANRYYFAAEHTDRQDEKIWLACLMLSTWRINNGLMK